jgi:hypothetical protein
MKRALAVLGAVLMIGAAVVIRNMLDDDEASAPNGGNADGNGGGPLTLICATELEPVCEALAGSDDDLTVVIQDAGTTADAVAAGVVDADGWLTFDPWPTIAELGEDAGDAVATSQLGIAVAAERAGALENACSPLEWRCLGDVVGQPWQDLGGDSLWGTVRVGVRTLESGLGLLVAGQATSGYFVAEDLPVFGSQDFDGLFKAWFRKLFAEKVPDPLTSLLTEAGRFSFVAATGAEVSSLSDERLSDVALLYPEPVARANVVLASLGAGDDAARLRDLLTSESGRAALGAAGWDTDVEPDASTDLPPAGVLVALRNL